MDRLTPRLLPHVPAFVKRQALVRLFAATADAFQCELPLPAPSLAGLSRAQCLEHYARFTADRAEEALRRPDDLSELQARLYRNAYRLGRMPGWTLRAHTVDDVMVLGRFLYSVLDIDFAGTGAGEITVARCYFSSFYTPEVCRLMSAMDRGLLAGLAGGGELAFTERITEGRPCCRAHFALEQVR